uniref:Capsid protein n=1 Tax=Torque teno Leptonychotes weddellii virus-1 TaxID=2012676 RepID=A0A1Z2RVM5_9VIRU|nr:ORF1 [Torque teno Leptonychotes weddellii virus 1]
MAIRRRRHRWPRRSRYRGRRKHFYRRRYPRYHRWRRRRHLRPRTASVRYYPSRRRKRISVRGWEPLGNICPTVPASVEAKPYLDLDVSERNIFEDNVTNSNWNGTWGHHFFTFNALLIRSKYYFNTWSSDWEGYDYLRFLGGKIWIPRMPGFSWMFGVDSSIQSNPKEGGPEDKYKWEKTWIHPGILFNRPGTRLMISTVQAHNRSFFRKLGVKPPAAWEGNYRMDVAKDFLLFHWYWSVCNITSSFYDFYCQRKKGKDGPDTCIQTPWFMGEKNTWSSMQTWIRNGKAPNAKKLKENLDKRPYVDKRAAWVNRSLYEKSDCVNTPSADTAIPSNFHNWGPFLPQSVLLDSSTGNSVYFRYKLYFEVSGDTLYRRLPSEPCKDSVIPPAPGTSMDPCPQVSSRSLLKKRKNPPSIYDILPGDLDEDGIITERAYERITGPDRCDQSTSMVSIPNRGDPPRKRVRFREPIGIRKRRKRKRARELLRLLLGRRGESRGGGPPPSNPPHTEPLDLLLNFPK